MRPITRWWKALSASPEVVESLQDRRVNFLPRLGGTNQHVKAAFERGLNASYGWMYANQPSVRSVVDYIATSSAQLGLKLYERIDDDERERDEGHPAAQTMRNPDDRTPPDAFIFRLVADFLVYNNGYFLKLRQPGARKLTLVRLPPAGVTVSGGRFRPDFYRIWRVDGSFFDVKPEDILHWEGYNPEDPLLGLSKLETLRQQLLGDAVLQRTLTELAKNGMHGGHIERPLDAPEWSEPGRQRFQESWSNQKRRAEIDGVLEEGMKYVRDAISPEDAQLLDSRKFTDDVVCKVYGMEHCPPEDDEERKAFYADVLAPLTKSLASQLCVSILEAEYGESDYYFEFDLNEKMRGDAEARFSAITAAAGAPWLTRNEVRAMENKPPIEGGDELITPMNVIVGNQTPALPAPNVMPIQDPNKPPQDGSYREQPKALTNGSVWNFTEGQIETKQLEVTTKPRREADMARQKRYIGEVDPLLVDFYRHQWASMKGKSVKAANSERWNTALGERLLAKLRSIVERETGFYTGRLGGDSFDMVEVRNYLDAMAFSTAVGLNRATQRDIEDMGPAEALKRAKVLRAPIAAANIGARVTVFSREEAAKQSPNPELRLKEWIKDTERHDALDGKKVPLDSDWGGISPGSEANCACSAVIS